MRKFTVIYCVNWLVGSHWQKLVKMERVEVDCDDANLYPTLAERVGSDDIQFVFLGHPPMQGE